jgi:hypothetical protein
MKEPVMKTFVSTIALMITVLGLSAETTFADHQQGLSDLAHDLQWKMNRVNRTLTYHFRGERLYREMSNDAADMNSLVNNIHEMTESGGCPKELFGVTKDLCVLVCELKDHVNEIRPAYRTGAGNNSYGGRFGHRSAYGVHGTTESDIRYLRGLLISMESTLSHLEQEIDVRTASEVGPSRFEPVPFDQVQPVLPPVPALRPAVPSAHIRKGNWSVSFVIR